MNERYLLGKIFISHSAKDKPFVRRLASRLWAAGYRVWLDEKELVPGDALATRLSDALAESRVVTVIITPHSLGSRWLAFELNKATERMVQGHCRVIPILKGDVEPPSELAGMLYADFRNSFRRGFAALLRALKKETDDAIKDSWAEIPVLLGSVFDEKGFASGGEYDRIDYDFVTLEGVTSSGDATTDAEIIYDVVHDYRRDKEPLSTEWWREYIDTREKYQAPFYLVVSERPVRLNEGVPAVESPAIRVIERPTCGHQSVILLVDMSEASDMEAKRYLLQRSREAILRLANP